MIGGRWGRAPEIAPGSSTRSGLSANSSPRSPICDPAGRGGLPRRRIRSHPAGRDCHLLLWPSDGANPTHPACSAGPAVRPCGSSSDAGSCRAANRTIRFRLGPAPNMLSENIQAAPSRTGDRLQDTNKGSRAVKTTPRWKSRKAGKRALRYLFLQT